MRTPLRFIFITALLLSASCAHAQLTDLSSEFSGNGLEYREVIVPTINPEYPKPGDTVTITLDSSTTNLDTSDIAWKVGGATKNKGIGETVFSLVMGGIGTRTVIDIDIISTAGKLSTKQIVLTPASIDLVWEADTYTPPFYKGKALYSRDSALRVIATPHISNGSGGETPVESLMYTWTVDGLIQNSQSGYGRNEVSVPTNYLNSELRISVKATTLAGDRTATQALVVRPIPPKIVAYEDHPLYGVRLEQAINGEARLGSREMSIIAYPYYFSARPESRLTYEWSMNNRRMSDVDSKKITFRNVEGSSGKSSVSLSVQHLDRLFQFAKTSFGILYDETASQDEPSI